MSDLRKDPISGDWVIIAPGRAKRPDLQKEKKHPRKAAPKRNCPFDDLKKTGNWPPLAAYPNEEHWQIAVIPNKYPALVEHLGTCAVSSRHGLYEVKAGVGRHELVVTRDHDKSFKDLRPSFAAEVMGIFQSRHRLAKEDKCLVYASTFFNWGPTVGGSVWHPHYQFIALPFIPPQTARSLQDAERYFKKHHRCVRCDVTKQELREKTRVIAENQFAVAMVPFAGRRPFEVRIVPKAHQSSFITTPSKTIAGVAALLQLVLKSMQKNVGDPDLNFFIHDAPLDGKDYAYHHWHIEVVPNFSLLGGFEFSTGIYINVVDPDVAAAVLRGEKQK
jgi:UDPglucose--hexose-1-phosphate uridylyltransferase